MSTITCLKELNKKVLDFEDIVIFTVNEQVISYKVRTNHLQNNYYFNSEIFTILDINSYELATKAYGYTSRGGGWPSSKEHDFLALTRLVKELYKIIEERELKYTKYNRFEIMDI